MPHRRLSVFNPKKFTAAVNKALKKTAGPKSVKAAKLLSAVGSMIGIGAGTSAALTSTAAAATVAVTGLKTGSPAASASVVSTTAAASGTQCDVCMQSGTVQDVVRCDECKKIYHFRCLEPPVKKTPKRRGYSWHCADCDPTVSAVAQFLTASPRNRTQYHAFVSLSLSSERRTSNRPDRANATTQMMCTN